MLEKAKFLEDEADMKAKRFSEFIEYVTTMLELEIKNECLAYIGVKTQNDDF